MKKSFALIPLMIAVLAASGCTTGTGEDGAESGVWTGGTYLTDEGERLSWCNEALFDEPQWMGGTENMTIEGTYLYGGQKWCHIIWDESSPTFGKWITHFFALDSEMNDMWIIHDTQTGMIEQHIVNGECVEGLC